MIKQRIYELFSFLWFRASIASAVVALVVICFINIPIKPEVGRVEIDLSGDYNGDVWQLYYDKGNGYSESNSVKARFVGGKNPRIDFKIKTSGIKKVRIDFGVNNKLVKIDSVKIYYSSIVEPRYVLSNFDAQQLKSLVGTINDIKIDNKNISYAVIGNDPFFCVNYDLIALVKNNASQFNKLINVKIFKCMILFFIFTVAVMWIFLKKAQQFYKKIQSSIYVVDYALFAIAISFCFFCFNQGDILHTGGSSFTYLNGHIKDFYEVNKELMGGNNYMPSTYIIFAIWNIPVWLLGLVDKATLNVGYVLFWYKLMTTVCLVIATIFLYKIGKIICNDKKNFKILPIIWVTSPILVFGQFIFGQYDIITVLFTIIGVYYFLKGRINLFVLFFAVAFTFKYFPLFIFIPLLLMVEKRPIRLICILALSQVPSFLESFFYHSSGAYKEGVGGFFALKSMFTASFPISDNVSLCVFITIWIVFCGIMYLKTYDDDKDFNNWASYVSMSVPAVFFIFVYWHPQWLVFITPFMAMTAINNRHLNYLMLLDFIVMIPFVGYVVNHWVLNVDQQMWILGLLGRFNPNLWNAEKVYKMQSLFLQNVPQVQSIFYSMIASYLVLNLILKYPKKDSDGVYEIDRNYLRLRFFGGVLIFVLPAVISYIVTMSR